jgi:hypothetical protein
MEKLRYSLFDLFAYALPGTLVITSLYVIALNNDDISFYSALQSIWEGATIYKAIFFILLSYVSGFLMSVISNYLLALKEKIIPPFKPGKKPTGNSRKFVVIREHCKENFKYIEQWNVLKNFAATLSLTVLIISILFHVTYEWFSPFYLGCGIISFVLLLHQASIYHVWALIDLDNAYNFYINGAKPS